MINKLITNQKILRREQGFTIIELVVVIILISILAVTIIPKMQASGGFEEITYQDEVVTKLRGIQLRTMQDTSASQCHRVLITNDKLGIPDDSCSSFVDNNINSTTIVKIIDDTVNFQYAGGATPFSFDHLGRPVNCSSPCQVSIVGQDQTLIVAINEQGYIYAAN